MPIACAAEMPSRIRELIESPAASCYWTALNFDIDQPDPRLLTTATDYGPESALAWEERAILSSRAADKNLVTIILGNRRRRPVYLVLRNRPYQVMFSQLTFVGLRRPWIHLLRALDQLARTLEIEPPVEFAHQFPCAFIEDHVNGNIGRRGPV